MYNGSLVIPYKLWQMDMLVWLDELLLIDRDC
jgi:hypothetical protein